MGSASRASKRGKDRPKKAQAKKSATSKLSPAPAKITQPRLIENVYSRKRLFSVLDNALKKPVIWITAQGGAGKTTLITSYLKEKKLPCLWYQIDSGDGDIASFFHYMGIAARYTAPRYKESLPHLTPEYLGGLPVFTRNYFRELFSRLKTPSVIVFDNYQDALADSSLHEIIQAGLSEIPEGINVVIISRTEPPSALAGLRANNRMNILGWDELELTTEETSGIVQLKLQKRLSAEIIQELHDKTNGWAAGLVLMLEHQGSADMVQRHGKGFTTQAMFDYFAGEIFHKLDTASQEILLQTSFLPIMTRRFAEQITGLHQAGELLSELNRRNYFTIRKPLPEPVYQYHPLFREFLLTQARKQLTDTQLIQTQQKAAEILEGAGQAEDAIILYSQTGDWASMARIILANAQAMIIQGRSKTLEEWIKEIPQAVVDETPWLQYWLGICRMTTSPSESESLLENAYHAFRAQGDAAGLFLAWAAVVDVIWLQQTDWAKFNLWLALIEEDRKRFPQFPNPEIGARVVACMCQIVAWAMPGYPRLHEYIREAEHLLTITDNPSIRTRLGTALSVSFQLCGDELSRARNIAKLTDRLSRQSSLAPLDELWTYIIRIFAPSHSGQYSDCVRLAEDALRLADESGIHIIDALFYGDGLHGALCGNDLKTADTMLAGMERAMAERPLNLDKAYYHHIQGWRVRLDGNNAGAVEHARSALTIAQRIGAGYPEIMCRYGLAHALLANGDLENAKSESAWIMTKVEAAGLRWLVYLCDLFDAQCAFMSGDDETGNRRLCSAMTLQEKYDIGFFHPLWRHEDILALYVKAMEHGCITAYVLRHIREQQLVPKQNSLIPDSWPFPIKLYTFGRFSLLIDDKPVQFTNRGQKKPMELLKALIALGGRDAPQAEIIDLLWPDTEGDASYRSLITCLQRLRNIIGYKDAVIHTESRMTLDTRYIWSDNWAFERLINHAEVMEKEGSQDKACETRIKALGYYKGSFLEKDTEMAWTLSMREQLRVKFIRQVELIGRYWEGANNWDKALECYQKALSIDNLSEVFYQRLMTAYKMLGRDSDAILAYQRCCKELSSRLGIPPSPATEEIYNSIQKR